MTKISMITYLAFAAFYVIYTAAYLFNVMLNTANKGILCNFYAMLFGFSFIKKFFGYYMNNSGFRSTKLRMWEEDAYNRISVCYFRFGPFRADEVERILHSSREASRSSKL